MKKARQDKIPKSGPMSANIARVHNNLAKSPARDDKKLESIERRGPMAGSARRA